MIAGDCRGLRLYSQPGPALNHDDSLRQVRMQTQGRDVLLGKPLRYKVRRRSVLHVVHPRNSKFAVPLPLTPPAADTFRISFTRLVAL